MTVAPSLFGVSWHKERWTKNKSLDFCPLGFSWLPYPSTVAIQFISIHVLVLSGSEQTFQGLRRIGRGARRRLVARKVTLTRGRGLAPRDSSALFRPFSFLDPTLPLLALLLISCYPGLRLTNCFCLRALRVSTFPPLPFFPVLNGRNVLIGLFPFFYVFLSFSHDPGL